VVNSREWKKTRRDWRHTNRGRNWEHEARDYHRDCKMDMKRRFVKLVTAEMRKETEEQTWH
jgi:hypothetical protein